jgi:hypothetical protein
MSCPFRLSVRTDQCDCHWMDFRKFSFLGGVYELFFRHIPILAKSVQKKRTLYMKTYAHLSLVFIMEPLFSVTSVRDTVEEK